MEQALEGLITERKKTFNGETAVDAIRRSGGNVLLWKNSVDLDVLRADKNVIHYRIHNITERDWELLCVYGPPQHQLRNKFCEKKGGNQTMTYANNEFRNFIKYKGLIDMGFVGPAFTWSNGAVANEPIFERLDRTVCTSDCSNETTRKIVEVGEELNKWSRKTFGNIFRAGEELKEKLLKTQMEAHIRDTRQEEKELCMEIEKLNIMQRKYYEQRSKAKWIPKIDKNTKAFHMSVLQRKKKNQIAALKLPNASWVTDANDIVQYLVKYFTDLFKRDA
ncbi:uncharacterized protein LOC113312281 [Papaver somniferum]|uniref:uncharacterized protein LOC113312281 n=1 Tax=Papaver somniferum TaxID=3469 RepID=UPI000E701709|nr:uncharacterized protein LOC113312281 [Papaver somniferum]